MNFTNTKNFFETANGRLLGMDVGHKTIGLALSNTQQTVAIGLKTLARTKFQQDLEALQEVIYWHDVGGLVVGLPLGMDGKDTRQSQSVRGFIANIQRFGIALPILLWDERLSTKAVVDPMIKEGDLSRKKQQFRKDTLAATWILQGALDAKYS